MDLYPPQADAIQEGVLDGDNMLLACPTASGKTLIAELAMLKHILEWNGKVIYLVPLKALAYEKEEEFKKYENLGIKTIVSTGDFDTKAQWLKNFDIIICSNEKADSLLRHQVSWMKDISLIISDEVHLITDPSRGPTLEIALSKLRQINPKAQILALSATINNAQEIADWLDAKLILSTWRPVILKEGVYLNGIIEFEDGTSEEIVNIPAFEEENSEGSITTKIREKKAKKTYMDPTTELVKDTLRNNGQIIIFTNTRKSTMSLASKLAQIVEKSLTNKKKEALGEVKEEILTTGADTTLRARLAQSVSGGVAFHHAGMHYLHRKIVEKYFKEKLISAICATPTLCLSPETKIWHEIHETKVSDFNNTDSLFVLSQDRLIPMHAEQISIIENFSPLIEISSVAGYSIRVTPNHKLLVKRENKAMIIPACKISKNDRIATIRKLYLQETNSCVVGDFVSDNRTYNANCKFDSDLSYFIGLMLGDGYSGAETKEGAIYYKGSPSIVGLEDEILSHAEKVCLKLDVSFRSSINSFGTPGLFLGKNKWFREFLVRCGVEKGDRKFVNTKLMKMDRENISHLLRGLFDSDGYVCERGYIGFSNISENLVKQVQKLLLRFGIVSRFRKRKGSLIKLHQKIYKTKPCYELVIAQKQCILDFYNYIGFKISRKQETLSSIILKITSNLLHISCPECGYRIFKSLFSGRTKEQKKWGKVKLSIIKLLGKKGELGSNEIEKIIGHKPIKKMKRLNNHYVLITKRKIGYISKTEWFWSLNSIGKWIYANYLAIEKEFEEFFNLKNCPLCRNKLERTIRGNWRKNDFEGDIFWDIVRETKLVKASPFVFDVVLPNRPENDHMFVANGFIVHNSAGLNLPARRVIIRDYKRYSFSRARLGNLVEIPVLEYKQMAGRAGRPKYDTVGEAILISKSEEEKNDLTERYLLGTPELITSKLAAISALRSHLLGIIATSFVSTEGELFKFLERTFYGHQYTMDEISGVISDVITFLVSEQLIEYKNGNMVATKFGKRVSSLYIDPLSGVIIRNTLKNAHDRILTDLGLLHLISSTPSMLQFYLRKKDYGEMMFFLEEHYDEFLAEIPDEFDPDFEFFLSDIKAAKIILDWIDEKDEEELSMRYNIGSGDLHNLVESANWLLYATLEIAKLLKQKNSLKPLNILRTRVTYGVKEELVELVTIKGIGRKRGRLLYRHGIKKIEDLRRAQPKFLLKIPTFGHAILEKIFQQIERDVEIPKIISDENKKKKQGQTRLTTF